MDYSELLNKIAPTFFSVLGTFILGILSTFIFNLLKTIKELVVGFARLETAFQIHKDNTEDDINGLGHKIRRLEEKF